MRVPRPAAVINFAEGRFDYLLRGIWWAEDGAIHASDPNDAGKWEELESQLRGALHEARRQNRDFMDGIKYVCLVPGLHTVLRWADGDIQALRRGLTWALNGGVMSGPDFLAREWAHLAAQLSGALAGILHWEAK